MRISARALLLAGLLTLAGCASQEKADSPQASRDLAELRARAALQACPTGISPELPDLSLPCLGAPGEVALRAARPSRPAVVNIWATWCHPCVTEVPTLVRLAHDGTGKLDVIGVLTEDTASNGLEFARQRNMHYPSVVDEDGQVMRRYSPGPPVTLFLDATGAIQFVQRGLIKNDAALRRLVHDHLGLEIPIGSSTP